MWPTLHLGIITLFKLTQMHTALGTFQLSFSFSVKMAFEKKVLFWNNIIFSIFPNCLSMKKVVTLRLTNFKWVDLNLFSLFFLTDNLAGQLESVLGGRIWDLQVPITCCWDRMDDRHTVVNPDTSWNDIIHLEDSWCLNTPHRGMHLYSNSCRSVFECENSRWQNV